ncbi:MAG: ATP-dependent DNA helicase RecG [Lachnospiraceae bacterium]|nr:ATP-dependent DNA helicase RecG [Lachnospiraceae bacterium]
MAITDLKGIGAKTAALFSKLGIQTIRDLIVYYPRTYLTYPEPVTVRGAGTGVMVAIRGNIASVSGVRYFNRKSFFEVVVADPEGERFTLSIFNQPYLKKAFVSGTFAVFYGRAVRKGKGLMLEQPKKYTPAEYEALQRELHSVYPLTKGLSGNTVSKAVLQALEAFPVADCFDPEFRSEHRLISRQEALRTVHFPDSEEHLREARRRLSFEEFFFFLLIMHRSKALIQNEPNAFPMIEVAHCDRLMERLPFALTAGQKKAWKEIRSDLTGPNCMNRLIQGDVGSGKTIIAFLALLMCAVNGYQGALMAPTEVLAAQHMESLQRMIETYDLPLKPVLLLGSMTAVAKREANQLIASGEANVIIGTHALIQTKVEYSSLGLVITDEQHRFGVRQRQTLAQKGGQPHILVMSATPIPRTLAMVLYGDLKTSVIRELPAERLPIKNCVVGTGYRPSAYAFMEKQIAAGRQVYIICPQVESGEDESLTDVVSYAEELKSTFPATVRIEYLHGRMTPAVKNSIMDRFSKGDIDLLVSTTVIEVGINVPNATVMMVENAERFGLAQLHQLRGRVGRGKEQSYCIFLSAKEDEKTMKRLEILNTTNDGFEIASKDLQLRGPGELFGVRQSGEFAFEIADVFADAQELSEASDAVEALLTADPLLKMESSAAILAEAGAYGKYHLDLQTL